MVGIYKIISPTGKVYIGQSWNIHKRWQDHKNPKKFNTPISKSVLKHGASAHIFKIIYDLPIDVTQETLTAYEQFFIDSYSSTGHYMLNIREAGCSGLHSESTKLKMSFKATGRKHTQESKDKMSLQRKGRPSPRAGYKMTPEEIAKMSERMKGMKHSEETKRKISVNHSKHNKGKHISESARAKMIASKTGKKQPESQKNKVSIALKGKPKTDIHNKKVSEALKKYYSTHKRVAWNKGKSSWSKGIPHTEEHKRNISVAHKNRFANLNPSTSYTQPSV